MITRNIAQFLGKIKDSTGPAGTWRLPGRRPGGRRGQPGQSPRTWRRIVEVARRCGAMVIGVGDTEQLRRGRRRRHLPLHRPPARPLAADRGPPVPSSVGAGRLAAAPPRRGGGAGRVRRPGPDLPRPAGPGYRRRGDAVADRRRRGRRTLLLPATSNETAARLARLARERLTGRGLVGRQARDHAGGRQPGRRRGDLVRARLNTRIDADGQTLANRDTIRIDPVPGHRR